MPKRVPAAMPLVSCLAAAVAGAACQQTYDNPFLAPAAVPAPAGATLFFVGNAYDRSANAPRELFAVDDRGGAPSRLTSCASRFPVCEVAEVAPAPDRNRVAVRRRADADRDGVVEPEEDDGIYVIDLARGLEGQTIPPRGITGLDWSPAEDVLIYSAAGEGGLQDLFSSFVNGDSDGNRTQTTDVGESRFRFNRRCTTASCVLVYERHTPGERTGIWLYRNLLAQQQLTDGDASAAPAPLAGTHYVVGGDADPTFAPDLTRIAFRRLTGVGVDGRGTWDILTTDVITGDDVQVVASGPAFRGAPDWGPRGIVFTEVVAGSATAELVVIDAGGERRAVYSQPAASALESPRWIP